MEDPRGLPLVVWVLIGFVISFVGIGGGVLIGRGLLDDEGATATTVAPAAVPSTTTASTAAPAPATTTAPTTAPPADTGGLASGLPDGFEWPHPDHPPFPFPSPAEVRGRVEDERHCGDDDEGDDEAGAGACLQSYTFSIDVADEDVTVDQVRAHLASAAPAAGWTPTEGAAAELAYTHSCGGGCHALVQVDVLEPERGNRGPRLEVVVTFDGH